MAASNPEPLHLNRLDRQSSSQKIENLVNKQFIAIQLLRKIISSCKLKLLLLLESSHHLCKLWQ